MSSASGATGPPPPDPPSGAGTVALARYRVLVAHLHDQLTLKAAAEAAQVPYRTAQQWLAAYRRGGLDALAKAPRRDKGRRRIPEDLVAFIEGLALKTPPIRWPRSTGRP